MGKKRCGMRVSLVHLQVCFKLGVILGLETQSRIGRKFGGEMHRVVGESDIRRYSVIEREAFELSRTGY